MIDYFLKVFSVNLQPIPNVGNFLEGGYKLVLVMRVAITLPPNEIRTQSILSKLGIWVKVFDDWAELFHLIIAHETGIV